jgi:uncharacterized protein
MSGDALLLAAALGAYGWYLRGGPFPPGFLTGRRFARLAARSSTLFGAVALLGLVLAGRTGALLAPPAEFAGAAAIARRWVPGMTEPMAFGLIALGLVIGGTVGALLSRWRGRVFALGDVTAVLPRHRRELGWAALLAVTSGVSEELFFRLFLPLAVAAVTGSGLVGFGVATLMFGFAHRYQGWSGMLATSAAGALLAAIYLASGAIWVAAALHAILNLNGLVLRPIAMGVLRAR